jgi:hypothetical protein
MGAKEPLGLFLDPVLTKKTIFSLTNSNGPHVPLSADTHECIFTCSILLMAYIVPSELSIHVVCIVFVVVNE